MVMVLSALDRKLLRDLWGLRGQVLAIALVIASGLAAVLMSLSTLDSLRSTRERYYADYAFAQVFASLKRAPNALAERIADIAGVAQVETRIVAPVTVDVAGFAEPVRGLALSLPRTLNRLYVQSGRLPESGCNDEIVLTDGFARAHGIQPGDRLGVIVNGRHRGLVVVGIVLTPEYVYQIGAGQVFPDFKRFGILWMGRDALEAADGMEGAFNDVLLTLAPGAREADVIAGLDALLSRYGGLGAYGRADQQSHEFLSNEFLQLEQMGDTFSVIFLGVSAFLLNMVMGRLVGTQREQIAALKAFGYSNVAVGIHYAKLVVLIVLVGSLLGVASGVWLGRGLSELYMDYYRFPYLSYELSPTMVVVALTVTAAAG